MSSTRMCNSLPFCVNDPSGTEKWKRIFGEDEDGWTTGQMTLTRKDKATGKAVRQEVDQDVCPDCTDARLGIRRADEADAAQRAKLDPRYIDWLERQTQVGPYKPSEGNGGIG